MTVLAENCEKAGLDFYKLETFIIKKWPEVLFPKDISLGFRKFIRTSFSL